jgi:hypothetical protein
VEFADCPICRKPMPRLEYMNVDQYYCRNCKSDWELVGGELPLFDSTISLILRISRRQNSWKQPIEVVIQVGFWNFGQNRFLHSIIAIPKSSCLLTTVILHDFPFMRFRVEITITSPNELHPP